MAKDFYKKPSPRQVEINYDGKVPPFSEELEQTILGQLMLEDEAIDKVIDDLKPESFYNKKHAEIYSAMFTINANGEPINLQTVIEQLKKNEKLEYVGGPFYIAQLTQNVASAAHIEHHAKLIAQKFIQRELIRVSGEILEQAFDPSIDVEELVNFSESQVSKVCEGNIKKVAVNIEFVLKEALDTIKKAQENKNKFTGKPTGFTELDNLTSGWQKGNMIVIAARPAMGKTAFVLSMLRNMAVDYKLPVAMFSLEMSNEQLVNRLIVSETEIEHDKIKRGELQEKDWVNIYDNTKKLANAPIFLDDTPALSITEFRSKCRRLHDKHNIECVFLDYLQLMTTHNPASREQEVSMISRQIKAVAMELGIPIIALSQLNRSVETRGGNKKPQLSDLRESGAIEQDADMVLFIHRPEYYGQEIDEDGNSTKDVAQIIVAKNRHGATRELSLQFTARFTKFTDRNTIPDLDPNKIPLHTNFDMNFENSFETQTFSSKMNTNSSSDFNKFDTSIETDVPY